MNKRKIFAIILMLPAIYLLAVTYDSFNKEIITAMNIVFLIIVAFILGLMLFFIEISKH